MKTVLFYSLVIASSILLYVNAFSSDHSWDNYEITYYTTVKVPLHGGTSVLVNLPSEYIKKRKIVCLCIDIESNFTYMIDGLKERGFEGFVPKLSVNGRKLFGCYTIPVKATPANQSVKIDIKTKHLKVGSNDLKFIFTTEPGLRYRCQGGKICMAYSIQKMYFNDLNK